MKKSQLLALSASLLLMFSCKEEGTIVTPTDQEVKEKDTVVLANPINDFTWKAMNSWYNWQEKVPSLADAKKDNNNQYYSYLNQFESPADLFGSLLFEEGKTDRFSWFIEDYEEQEKQFQGIYKSWGFTPAVVDVKINDTISNPVILVMKVSKNSPASKAGFKRGDFIVGLDGQLFNKDNFKSAVEGYYNENAEFILGNKKGEETSRVNLTKVEVADDAIQLTKVLDVDGKKVGYFVYNGFRSSYDQALNDAFGELKAAGIQELILDLRYNGGGSVLTSGYLASMIYGEGKAEEELFAKTVWNSKHPDQGFELPFLKSIYTYDANGKYIEGGDVPINRLTGIQNLYVITSHSTASASEMIINGLRPYMNVITVGETTYGKNVGSITLYDSPKSDYADKSTANPKHKNAMQPITFQIFNSKGESDYTTGFTPDIEVKEIENLDGFLPFGDENETILKTILNKMKGVSARPAKPSIQTLSSRRLEKPKRFENEMYFESEYIKNLK